MLPFRTALSASVVTVMVVMVTLLLALWRVPEIPVRFVEGHTPIAFISQVRLFVKKY